MKKSDCFNKECDESSAFGIEAQRLRRESAEAKEYVLNKPMLRPKTNVFTVLLIILLYGGVCFGVSFGLVEFAEITDNCLRALTYFAVYMIGLSAIAKTLCIKLVLCYQHYAKESTRRKCLCKPTCSEYALAVLRKYNLFVALHKIRKRLFITCKDDYKIDEP